MSHLTVSEKHLCTTLYFQAAQLSHAVAPASALYFQAGHVVHDASPTVFLYLPAAHTTHVAPLGPEYPALHLQSVSSSLAAGELE